MVVNFKDYIVVVEGPSNEARGDADYRRGEEAGSRQAHQVRHQYPRAFRSQRGLRPFVAEGATIVTSQGNKGYWEHIMQNPHTIAPDKLWMMTQHPKVKVEYVGESKKMVGGDNEIDLYHVDNSMHNDAMLMVYLPKQKVLIEADEFNVLGNPAPTSPAANPNQYQIMCRNEYAEAIDKAVFPGLQGGPHNHTTAAIAVALKEASTPEFKAYAKKVVSNAKTLADELLARGFDLVSGGTDNHLILVDLTNKKVIGKKGAKALDAAGIVCNYNTVPYDPRKPFSSSGLRLGTPAVTSRGMGDAEMRQIAKFMDAAIAHVNDEAALTRIAAEVTEMCRQFPAPGIALS